MAADAEATLPSLIEAVKAAIPNDRKAAIEKRGEAAKKAQAEAHDAHPAGGGDRLGRKPDQHRASRRWRLWGADQGPRLVAGRAVRQRQQLAASAVADGEAPPLARPLGRLRRRLRRAGAVGAALANRDLGRFSVSIQGDGDLMYAPGVLWTAAKHKIPLLSVMHNNRGYHQELMHVQRLSSFRNRVASLGGDIGPIGTSIMNPDIEYHKLAESMGWWAKGPIKDPAELGPAIKEAVAVVKSGQPALLNVWTQPR